VNRLRIDSRWALVLCVALASGIAASLAGCSVQGSKRASLYEKLEGTWSLQEVRLDGTPVDFRGRSVTLTFGAIDSSRTYTVKRPASGDTTSVTGQADISDRQLLAMVTGFGSPVVWAFTFDAPSGFDSTVQFSLRQARDESVRTFLETIGLSGGARTVEMDLVRE